MSRPCKQRRICCHGARRVLKPAGVPTGQLSVDELQLDELEAVRLCDLRGFHQQRAAELMGVSRPTLGRILESGRRKLARLAVEEGLALAIGGGNVMDAPDRFRRGNARCRRHANGHSQERGRGRGSGRGRVTAE